ncbi:hypothetical protein CAK95_04855 [Pseudorhodoplanes sinuspersici]|uniref:TonB-dependent receptor n=2 Tax=Pseudorhodoplanes sinuspersici TaxID=1235591 RepID=A0A1W6ZZE8_9HYPH|nr:hypothetical protein CAK95_04855 [Pseudorhodoplanes sinuspersici]
MLWSSGLSPRFTGGQTVTLTRSGGAGAMAQATPSGAIALDEITVQGEKVARDYFRTYTSVGVVTGQQISDYNIPDLQRSFDMLANVRQFRTGDSSNGFVIRGLNSEGVTAPSGSSAPLVSVIIDGAIQSTEATRRGARGIWDVEQIEVLRGPQSTIQGRNALAGAVVIKTNDPTYKPGVIVEGQAGGSDYHMGAFVVNTPLVQDQMALRIAGQTIRQSNNINYSNPAYNVLGEDQLDQIRAKLLITPSAMPGLRALFTVNRTLDNPMQTTVTGPDFFARQYNAAFSQFPELRTAAVNNYIADISYEFSPGLKVQSITALADTKVRISGPNEPIWFRDDRRNVEDFSQDLRFSFDQPDSPLSGVVGLFAGRFKTQSESFATTSLAPFFPIQDATFNFNDTSIAAYADLRYRVWDKWTLLAGGRLLRDKSERNFAGMAWDPFSGTPPTSLNEVSESSNTEFLPKIGLAYDLTTNQTLAGTVTKGYRKGFSEVPVGTTIINQVDPEFMWAYELAYRSKWWGDRLQLNANVFYYDYKDQQLAVEIPGWTGQSMTQNVGKSHLYGGELEVRVRPVDELTLFASVGLLKTKFDEATTFDGGTLQNYAGNEFPEAPSVTVSAGGIWKHQSGMFVSADVSYTDGYFSPRDLSNNPLRYVDSYTLVNAQIGYETKNGTLAIFARNLFDEQYLTSISTPGLSGSAAIGDGRVVGVRGQLRF